MKRFLLLIIPIICNSCLMNSKTKNGIKPEKEIENRIANQQDLSDSTETIAGSTHNYISKKDSLELNTIQRIAIQTPYIIHTQNGIELFTRDKIYSVNRGQSEKYFISKNQMYFAKQNLDKYDSENSGAKTYNLEMYDLRNQLISNATIKSLDNDEGTDRIVPFNNGRGFLQVAFRLGSSFSFKVFELDKKNRFVNSIAQQMDKAGRSILSLSNDSKNLVHLYSNESEAKGETNKLTIEKWSTSGALLWRRELKDKIVSQQVYQSDGGEYIAFGYSTSLKNPSNSFCVLNVNGKLIFDRRIDSIAYDDCQFIINRKMNAALIQGRKSLHLLDLKSGKQIFSKTIDEENTDIIQTAWIKENIISMYSSPKHIQGRKKYFNNTLCVTNVNYKEKCFSISIDGKPELIINDTSFYLKFELDDTDFKYYKIKTPLYEKDN